MDVVASAKLVYSVRPMRAILESSHRAVYTDGNVKVQKARLSVTDGEAGAPRVSAKT